MDQKQLDALSKVPKHLLIHCASQLYNLKNKSTLVTGHLPQKALPKKPKMATGKVMLAHPYKQDKHEKKVAGWWMSIKYDGVRGKWNGEEMESRTGKIYTLPDFVTEQLEKITDEEGNPMELDGEIWFGNDTFAIASGSARRFENDSELWKQMTYMVFDTPDTELPFEERIKKVATALKRSGSTPNIKGVKHVKFNPAKTTIEAELIKVEQDGGEGLVLRAPGSMYVYDSRSHDMLKVKSWSYKDAIVKGYVEGINKYTGLVGSLAVHSNEFGDEDDESEESAWVSFKVGSGLKDWQRASGSPSGNWKTKEVQTSIDNVRREELRDIDKDDETYKDLVNTINTETGKKRNDALHEMNDLFAQMPVIGSKICFRFKELTKQGHPSFPTFVCCRDDYEHE